MRLGFRIDIDNVLVRSHAPNPVMKLPWTSRRSGHDVNSGGWWSRFPQWVSVVNFSFAGFPYKNNVIEKGRHPMRLPVLSPLRLLGPWPGLRLMPWPLMLLPLLHATSTLSAEVVLAKRRGRVTLQSVRDPHQNKVIKEAWCP